MTSVQEKIKALGLSKMDKRGGGRKVKNVRRKKKEVSEFPDLPSNKPGQRQQRKMTKKEVSKVAKKMTEQAAENTSEQVTESVIDNLPSFENQMEDSDEDIPELETCEDQMPILSDEDIVTL